MFEDEMTEADLASTAEHYYRVTQQEKHFEGIAVMKAYISCLEATVAMLKRREAGNTLALMASRT